MIAGLCLLSVPFSLFGENTVANVNNSGNITATPSTNYYIDGVAVDVSEIKNLLANDVLRIEINKRGTGNFVALSFLSDYDADFFLDGESINRETADMLDVSKIGSIIIDKSASRPKVFITSETPRKDRYLPAAR